LFFSSYVFLGFFVVVYPLYLGLRGSVRAQNVLLVIANFVFYGYWDWRFLPLQLLLTAVNFVCGDRISRSEQTRTKRAWLLLSIAASLMVLGYFKYYNFFTDSLVEAARALGIGISIPTRQIILPLGISYYVLQMLTYTLDVYRGTMKPTRSPLEFAVFTSFFGHIVAGPITRARQFLPQLKKARRFDLLSFEEGLRRILLGLFKKLCIADALAFYLVDPVFASPSSYTQATLWLAMVGYAVQIYADFSGYSSMAVGVARLLGFKLPENFLFPYLSLNIAEFWRRWHITLSRWLRDYLWWGLASKTPMAGGLKVRLRSQFNFLAVFLICGLWHGASWTFIAWGGLHGLYLVIYDTWHRWKSRSAAPQHPGKPFYSVLPAWLVTQAGLLLAWVLFRSATFSSWMVYLRGLVSSTGTETVPLTFLVWMAFVLFAVDHLAGWILERRPTLTADCPAAMRLPVYGFVLAWIVMFGAGGQAQFIYSQF
jgi:alginate O-acetyltransferase complex protein AlgI